VNGAFMARKTPKCWTRRTREYFAKDGGGGKLSQEDRDAADAVLRARKKVTNSKSQRGK